MTTQSAASVVVEAVGAGVHALEHVWGGRTGYGLTASLLPPAALKARQPKILAEGDTGTWRQGDFAAPLDENAYDDVRPAAQLGLTPKTQTRSTVLRQD